MKYQVKLMIAACIIKERCDCTRKINDYCVIKKRNY